MSNKALGFAKCRVGLPIYPYRSLNGRVNFYQCAVDVLGVPQQGDIEIKVGRSHSVASRPYFSP